MHMDRLSPIIAVMNDWGSVAGIFEDLGAIVLDVEYTSEVSRALRNADALVLTGGGDIDPERYGYEFADRHPQVYGVSQWRDEAEFAAVRMARKLRIPVLGICRGHQLINVSMGGTLHQHIHEDAPSVMKHSGGDHAVKLRRESYIGRRFRSGILAAVTSLHHQAVDRLGPGLIPVGWATDGTVEMIETAPGVKPYMLGTQFHPEMDVKYEGYDADIIFETIYDRARNHCASVGGNTARLADVDDLLFGHKLSPYSYRAASETTQTPSQKSVDQYMFDVATGGPLAGSEDYMPRHITNEAEYTRDIAYWEDDANDEDSYEAWSHRMEVTRLSRNRGGLGTLAEADNMCILNEGCKSPFDCLEYGSCAAECVAKIEEGKRGSKR